jgi:hypothetical protein
VNATDSRIFWTALYAAPIAWGVLAVLAIFRLQASWFLVTLVAISMNMANVVGYSKCEKVLTIDIGCKEEINAICCRTRLCAEYCGKCDFFASIVYALNIYTNPMGIDSGFA